MGRLAGNSVATQKRLSWQEQVKLRREEKQRWGTPPARMLAQLPAARRQMALLWSLSRNDWIIGAEDSPPLTRDMRNLMAKGYARLERRVPTEFWGEITEATPRRNYLVLTDKGRAAVDGYEASDAELNYLRSAFYHGVAR